MFERFTDRARRAVVLAQEEARGFNAGYIGSEHLLLGVLGAEEPAVEAALAELDWPMDEAAAAVRATMRRYDNAPIGHVPFTAEAKNALELTIREMLELGQFFIAPEHLLLGLVRAADPVFIGALKPLQITPGRLRAAVLSAIAAGKQGAPPTPAPRAAVPARPRDAKVPQPTASPAPAQAERAVRLFVSYSHKDERHRKNLETHLAATRRGSRAIDWYDRRIPPGVAWQDAIDAELDRSDVVVLLLSPDFLASDYCYGVEMGRALERHKKGEARVVPVLVRPCDWRHDPIQQLQLLPTGAKPVTEWPNRDRAWLDVVNGLRAAIADLGS